MSSKLSSIEKKSKLFKDRSSSLKIVIAICYVFCILFVYLTLEEFYKLKTFVVHQCEIQSIDLKYSAKNYFPRWNLTIVDGNERTNHCLIQSIGSKSDRWAWIKANKYQINKTYPCYRSRDRKSILRWNWQWNKPNGFQISIYFSFAIFFFLLAFGLIKLKEHYQMKFKEIEQFHIRENNEEQILSPI